MRDFIVNVAMAKPTRSFAEPSAAAVPVASHDTTTNNVHADA